MQASKFIRDQGIPLATKVINSAPGNAESYWAGNWGGYYFREKPNFQFHNGIHEYWNITENNGEYFKKRGFDPVILKDLKRLVDSFETVGLWGGISAARAHLQSLENRCSNGGPIAIREQYKILHLAIRDYESIFLIPCTHGFDVACLICGFGTVDGERVYRIQGGSHE